MTDPTMHYMLASAAILACLSALAATRTKFWNVLQRSQADVVAALEEHLAPLREEKSNLADSNEQLLALLRTNVELAVRRNVLTLSDTLHDQPAELYNTLHEAMDLTLYLRDVELIDANAPMNLLEEILDTLTIEGASQMFEYVEARLGRLTANIDPKRGAGLTLLRLCNELKRRLSKANDTAFCGRISLLLASVYPLSERSAINLRCEFNVENVTHYENEPPAIPLISMPGTPMSTMAPSTPAPSQSEATPMEIDQLDTKVENSVKPENEASIETNKPVQVNAESTSQASSEPAEDIYGTFWSLQKYCAYPPSLLKDPGSFEQFKKGTELTLREFRKFALRDWELAGGNSGRNKQSETKRSTKRQGSETKQGDAVMEADAREARDRLAGVKTSEAFFPKYLTSKNITTQEMADPYFQRQVLLQLFLIVDYILQATTKNRERITKLPTLNKSIIPPKDVTPEEEAWANEAKAKIQRELINTPPNGRRFVETINVVMKSERRWAEWKAKNCPVWERAPLDLSTRMEDLRGKHKRMTSMRRGFRFPVGTMALSRLWTNDFANTSYLVSSTRFRTPTFEEYVEKHDILDDNGLLRAPYPPRAARDVNFGTMNAYRQWKVIMCKKAERKKVMEMEAAARAAAGAKKAEREVEAGKDGSVKKGDVGDQEEKKEESGVEGGKEKDMESVKKEGTEIGGASTETLAVISEGDDGTDGGVEKAKEETEGQVIPKEVLGKRKDIDSSEDAEIGKSENQAGGSPSKKLKVTDASEVENIVKNGDVDGSDVKMTQDEKGAGADETAADGITPKKVKQVHAIEENETETEGSTPKKVKLSHAIEGNDTDADSLTPKKVETSDDDRKKSKLVETPKEPKEPLVKRSEYEVRLSDLERMETDFKENAPKTAKRRIMNENVEISTEEQEAYDLRMWRGIRLASRHHLTLGRSGRVEDFGLILMEAARNKAAGTSTT